MASDIDTATPERDPRRALWSSLLSALGRLIPVFRRAPRAAANESPSLLRRRRSTGRRYSPLTRRILLLNIVPVALLALGAVYLSDYEEELIDAELASLLAGTPALRRAYLVGGGVRDLPTRVKCAILPWHTLHAALNSGGSASTEAEQDPMQAPIGDA